MGTSFDLALAQAIAWCAPRANPADPAACLRSADLRPPLLATPEIALAALVNSRSYADLATKAATPVKSVDELGGGRLLVYHPDAELSDGAAEAASGGFFDVFNAPPWDTWVALLHDERNESASYSTYLVSWVPPSLLACASEGISVNPEEGILWLDDADVPLRRELRARRLLAIDPSRDLANAALAIEPRLPPTRRRRFLRRS